jgi:hypothetical protein
VANRSGLLSDNLIEFFDDANRPRRMEESVLHHKRSPQVRELGSQAAIDRFLTDARIGRNMRYRQAVDVLVRLIMERRGWQKASREGSFGV